MTKFLYRKNSSREFHVFSRKSFRREERERWGGGGEGRGEHFISKFSHFIRP